jgi:hypothetical protein
MLNVMRPFGPLLEVLAGLHEALRKNVRALEREIRRLGTNGRRHGKSDGRECGCRKLAKTGLISATHVLPLF